MITHIQGIETLTLVLASICPPRSNKSFTMFVLPLLEATCSGVIPFYTMKRTNKEHDGLEKARWGWFCTWTWYSIEEKARMYCSIQKTVSTSLSWEPFQWNVNTTRRICIYFIYRKKLHLIFHFVWTNRTIVLQLYFARTGKGYKCKISPKLTI